MSSTLTTCSTAVVAAPNRRCLAAAAARRLGSPVTAVFQHASRPSPSKRNVHAAAAHSSTAQLPELVSKAASELEAILHQVDGGTLEDFMTAIIAADKIACYGVGREGLEMKSFAMRLFHLGFQVAVVGDMNCPAVGQGDVLIVSAGPGYFSTVAALIGEAQRAGAKALVVTASPNPGLQGDVMLQVPAQTLPPNQPIEADASATGRSGSVLQMGSAYELALQLLFDLVSIMLQQRLRLSDAAMKQRHTNLE